LRSLRDFDRQLPLSNVVAGEIQENAAVFAARENPANPHSDWVQAYMKLEKKLHRAYLDH
jgi:hypothetical protein